MKVRQISRVEEINVLEETILAAAETTAAAIRNLFADATGIRAFAQLRFASTGRDPLANRPLNFVEQLNQTFTYLATCDALKYLFARHPDVAPFVINLGTQAGHDIASEDGSLIAEVFAATHTASNGKLRKDLKKLRANCTAAKRYLFYACPSDSARARNVDPLVEIVPLRVLSGQRENETART